MKQNYLKSLLLMLLMCVGMGAWAEEVQIYLNEGAAGTANGITASGNVNKTASNGNPGYSFANTSSSNTTFTFSGFNVSSYSDLKLVLDAKWGSFPSTTNTFPSVSVKAYKNDVEVFSDATTIAVNSKVTTYNEYTVNITADFDKIVLTSNPSQGKSGSGNATTVYSLYMDNIKVLGTQEAGAAPVNSLTISPAAGTYETAQNVTLTAGLAGSTIYYTTDGTEPTTSSAVYTAAIPVTTAATIKALAVKDGSENVTAEAAYTIKPAQPSYMVDGNSVGTSKNFRNSAEVTISAADGCNIYYTTDGTNPTASSIAYTEAITVTETVTIKAIAVDAYNNVSSYKTLTLTLIEGTLFAFDSAEAIENWGYTVPVTISTGTDIPSNASFVADGITVQVNKGGSNNTRMWYANSGYDLRLYGSNASKGSVVVTAPAGYNVTSVIFEGSTVNMSNLTNKAWAGEESSVTFEATTNQRIENITVKIEAIVATGTLTLAASNEDGYWATFSSTQDVIFDANDIVAYTVAVEDGSLVMLDVYSNSLSCVTDKTKDGGWVAGYYVQAGAAVLINSLENSVNYYYIDTDPYTANDLNDVETDPEYNMLRPASVAKEATGYMFYKLAYASSSKDALGFYWGAANGAAFTSREGSAYLAVPNGGGVKGYSFTDAETAIKNVETKAASSKTFNLQGQRVNAAQKGIYIMNGRKVVK